MIEPMTEKKMKPCPFCGQENVAALMEADPERLSVFVHCYSCGGRGAATAVEMEGMYHPNAADVVAELGSAVETAVDDWNMRAGE